MIASKRIAILLLAFVALSACVRMSGTPLDPQWARTLYFFSRWPSVIAMLVGFPGAAWAVTSRGADELSDKLIIGGLLVLGAAGLLCVLATGILIT